MTEAKSSRSLRLLVAAVLLLPVLYILSDGPAMYCVERKWIEFDTFMAIWGPLPEVLGVRAVDTYESWWCEIAWRHGGPRR